MRRALRPSANWTFLGNQLPHRVLPARPPIGLKTCDIHCMKQPASLNGGKQTATKLTHCHAKECPKLGALRSVVDGAGNCKWTYFICDEHFRLLDDYDKKYIARTKGTKGE